MVDAAERRLSAASGMVAVSVLWQPGATLADLKAVLDFAEDEWRRQQAPAPRKTEAIFR